jgi:hypothetical protein
MAGSSPGHEGNLFLDSHPNKDYIPSVVSIEGALMRRIESGKRPAPPVWFAARPGEALGHRPRPLRAAADRSRACPRSTLKITSRATRLVVAGMETPLRRKKRLRLKSSVPKRSRGLRKKSAGSRKRGPGALWEERRGGVLRDDSSSQEERHEDRCVSQRSLPSSFLPRETARDAAGCAFFAACCSDRGFEA